MGVEEEEVGVVGFELSEFEREGELFRERER